MMNMMSPVMMAQMALQNPELLAQVMAASGRTPPASAPGLNIQTASAPAQPALSPMPAPTTIAPAAASTPAPAGPMPTLPAPPQAPTMPPQAAGTQEVDPMQKLAAAMAGVGPSSAGQGPGGAARAAPAPFIGSAMSPAMLAIMQQLQQGQGGAPSLGALIRGG